MMFMQVWKEEVYAKDWMLVCVAGRGECDVRMLV